MLKQVERDIKKRDVEILKQVERDKLAHLRFQDDNKGRDAGMPKQVRHDIGGARQACSSSIPG